jgi:hypothetical protein
MSVFRRTRTAPATPAPETDLDPLGSAVDELLKPIQRREPRTLGSAWRRMVGRPKA